MRVGCKNSILWLLKMENSFTPPHRRELAHEAFKAPVLRRPLPIGLYVLYEVLSWKPVAALQSEHVSEQAWPSG